MSTISNMSDLKEIAIAMVAEGKGILAADESHGTIEKRFQGINVESSEENRRSYRQMLFKTPEVEEFISGVILFDETIRQSTDEGTPFAEFLSSRGIIPGIKVDKGAKDLPNFPGETITEGLDGLLDRLKEYKDLGAKFTKWRAVISIGLEIPSTYCIQANAHALARYAALSQEGGLVPIVEPEVLMDGDHTIERCFDVTRQVLTQTFVELNRHRVDLEGTVLKPNMVLSGKDCPEQAPVEQAAEMTVSCLKSTVPPAVPGIAFLSGGQNDEIATVRLNAMNALGQHPWELTFSFGRGLQAGPLKAWNGQAANVHEGQDAFFERAKANGEARYGKYSGQLKAS